MRAPQSPLFRLLIAWTRGYFSRAVSAEIWLEYEEIVTARAGQTRWLELMELISFTRRERPSSLLEKSPAFRFRLIAACPDDDKFADRGGGARDKRGIGIRASHAITADADYVITSDKHFAPLIGSGYKPQPITPEEFIARHLTPAP